MPWSNIGRTSDSPSNPGQCFWCNSMNSVAIRTASPFESAFRIAQPPMTSLLSVNGPSVTVILPPASRTRTPSLLGSRPPVSTSVPSFNDFSTNLPIASISSDGGGDWRYDSGWRMNVRYFMAPPLGFGHRTNEPSPDRHASGYFHQKRSTVSHIRRWCRCEALFVGAWPGESAELVTNPVAKWRRRCDKRRRKRAEEERNTKGFNGRGDALNAVPAIPVHVRVRK